MANEIQVQESSLDAWEPLGTHGSHAATFILKGDHMEIPRQIQWLDFLISVIDELV